ncbi:MAG: hypothetical protein ACRCUJ_07510 [Phocaeicola sp.]
MDKQELAEAKEKERVREIMFKQELAEAEELERVREIMFKHMMRYNKYLRIKQYLHRYKLGTLYQHEVVGFSSRLRRKTRILLQKLLWPNGEYL